MATHKGRRTPWFSRDQWPVNHGFYECHAKITSSAPPFKFDLEWDGVGFLVPFPMVIVRWRGLKHRPRGANHGS